MIKKLKFFKNLKFFEDCSYAQINSLFYSFKEISCQKNHIVFSENEEADQIYFIREGEFAVKIQKYHYSYGLLINHNYRFTKIYLKKAFRQKKIRRK